jgi:hypothetical protein
MASNPYTVNPPNVLQALMMGTEGYDRGRKFMNDAALSEAGQLYAAGDLKGAQAAAARGGSLQHLMGFANLQNNDRDFRFRESEAGRAQTNADRGFGLQERQLGQSAAQNAAQLALQRQQFGLQQQQFGHTQEVANRAEVREITDPNGNKSLVRIDRQGNATPINTGQQPAEANNPFLTGGPMKEEEAKAALYTNRMLASEKVLRNVEQAGTSYWNKVTGAVSDKTGYNVRNQESQKFDQAQRDFINATLRRESGAVISEAEFFNARQQYFPQPGDTAETLAQKRANRAEAIKGIGAGAGRGYKPTASFDAQGGIVERGQPATQRTAAPPIADGATATNPQTGQKIMFRGGQWVPAQ